MIKKYQIKIDRVAAWVLLVSIVLYVISGFAMTKGILDPIIASKVHSQYLTYIMIAAFTVHTSFAISLALRRWKLWNNISKIALLIVYLIFIGSIVFIDQLYSNGDTKTEVAATEIEKTSNNADADYSAGNNEPSVYNDDSEQNDAAVQAFTKEELAQYDGKDGNKAYVAVDGDVYDLTSVFRNGTHYSHFAGKELTSAFYKVHVKNELSKYPIVGKLVD